MEYHFSDLFSWTSGKPVTPNSGQIPVYGSNGIIGYSSEAKYNNKIILGRVGAYCGSVAYCDSEFDATDNTLITTCNTAKILYKYAYYLLVQFNLNKYAGGAAQPLITQGLLNHLKCDIPTIDQQQRVVDCLSAYDNLIEVNNKRIKVLEQMAENLYKEWFVRFRFPGHETAEFEDGIPKGWEYCLLDSIAFVTMGQSPESQYYNYDSIGLPFHQGVGSYGEYYLVDDMYSSQGVRIAEPNSIIFSVRAPVGRINLTLNRIILGRGVAGINSKEGKNWFLLYLLKNRFSAEDLIGNGSIFSSVKKEELLKQRFLIPSSSLIDEFDSFARKIEGQIRLAHLSNKNLVKQRDLLLPRLMSGKLEV